MSRTAEGERREERTGWREQAGEKKRKDENKPAKTQRASLEAESGTLKGMWKMAKTVIVLNRWIWWICWTAVVQWRWVVEQVEWKWSEQVESNGWI